MLEIKELANAINELLLRGAEKGVNYELAIAVLTNRIIAISSDINK
ncbi:hypothetical protein [Pseudoalteromonas ruthenica]|nr:hypothetical protein [Pseudoalteromonas ruthenica]